MSRSSSLGENYGRPGTVARRVHELFELGVGHGVSVDEERLDLDYVVVVTARRVLPRVLHVHADVVASFDLDARDLEAEARCRNPDHAITYGGGRGGRPGRP